MRDISYIMKKKEVGEQGEAMERRRRGERQREGLL